MYIIIAKIIGLSQKVFMQVCVCNANCNVKLLETDIPR